MNVLLVGAEVDPFAKVGGLADVTGSLPKALRRLGVDARVIMPDFGFIDHQRFEIETLFSFPFPIRKGVANITVSSTTRDGVEYYFLRNWPYFGEEDSVYTDWNWDMPRYIFFNQAVMAVAYELKQRTGWFPDIFHVNDWHTGLIPFLIDISRGDPNWRNVGTMLTIHNMKYQGDYAGGWLFDAGIPGRDQGHLVYQNLTDNLLAIAMAHADKITTVSPRYALEIQYPENGYGLENLLRTRLDDLSGILNGIDLDRWNPETDPKVPYHYDQLSFEDGRQQNKRHLQSTTGLPIRDDVPVIGIVSRLVWQKGLDMAMPALHQLLGEQDIQVVGVGSGEEAMNDQLYWLGANHPGKAHTHVGYNGGLAQLIYSGADIFLMPSRFEPCGIGQMLAMRYGALPLVRETGGLADTVHNYDNAAGESGTGFVFLWESPDAILGTLRWALDTYRDNPAAWRRMQHRAMQTDFSWDKSAQDYHNLYQQIYERRKD